MNTYILSFLIVSFAFTGLAIGLIVRSKPITGSCGGVMTTKDGTCTICGKTESNNCIRTDS